MNTHYHLQTELALASQFYSGANLNLADTDKKTVDKEADLTVEDMEQMEQEKAEENYKGGDDQQNPPGTRKGSSGPEEKDISARI